MSEFIGILRTSSKVTYGLINNKFCYPFHSEHTTEAITVPCKRHYTDLYVIIKQTPGGWRVKEIIGKVSDYMAYSIYRLKLGHMRSSNFNCKVSSKAITTMQLIAGRNIVTIDSPGAEIYDDAIEIVSGGDIIVYIANVIPYLQENNLWDKIDNPSSIYLPDKVIHMLPNPKCVSLQKHERRNVLAFLIHNGTCIFTGPTEIIVSENYTYQSVLNEPAFVKSLSDILHCSNPITIVNTLMILVNKSLIMPSISRSVKKASITIGPHQEISEYIERIYNPTDTYVVDDTSEYYATITSPIRRVVDIVNSIRILDTPLEAQQFMQKVMNNLDVLNASVRTINRIQRHSHLLANCYKGLICNGYAFEVHMLYLPHFKVITKVKKEVEIGKYYRLKAFLFPKAFGNKVKFDVLE